MKVCLALLVDYKLQNYARKIAFDINRKYNTGFIAARLPQHVTLGPLFEVQDIKYVEEYFDFLAKSLKPLEIKFTSIDLRIIGDEKDGLGVLWMDIEENDNLRELHNRIYKDIGERSWKADEIFGDGIYHFHSTIALGKQPPYVYKEIYDNIQNKQIDYTCLVKEIALFCPSDDENRMGTYITYKKLPLGGEE
ncbi:2'-5' RNA ligase family protein [Thermohalobacter berrensis]|uniref:Phosphoesterase n=1 Tax=Thermohalobacter berrensis TaxID=99594 RepID=A0A419T4V3_9FIRM|nr:2'-5' RNA ligase family protein [Thermohalobacter berrensis]RKD32463.1 hypothetical protein BET03_11155 [Thermohalobacter berrensis]